MEKYIPKIIGGFICYMLASYFLIYILNFDVPSSIETIITAIAIIPLTILALPWLPILETLGLTGGMWIVTPTFIGFILVTVMDALILYGVLRLSVYLRGKVTTDARE